jgi:hypothetical protein
MLTISGSEHRLCDGISRRDFLRIGGLGTAGLAMPELFQGQATATAASRPVVGKSGKAKSCILLFMGGGPSQLATFDLKSEAPAEIRGDFKPIATDVPGTQICDHLPMLSRLASKYAIVRSVTNDGNMGAHGDCTYQAITGHRSPRVNRDDVPPSTEDYPCIGSAMAKLRPAQSAAPSFVWLLDMYRSTFAGEGAGFLGKKYDPFRVLQDPSRSQFEVPALKTPTDVSMERLGGRQGLLEQMSRHVDQQVGSPASAGMNIHYERAFQLIGSPKFRKAFDLKEEPESVRERYGKTKFGQGTLLARRLVEHGVPLVTVFWNGSDRVNWDSHQKETEWLKELLPPTDRGFSALLEDLEGRGLLDDTLVVWMGEFGRAPKLESNAGRGHWGRCYSLVMAGAGIRGGLVFGKSDRQAGYPAENAVSSADIVTTIYHALGVNTDTELTDQLGRPLRLCQGDVIQGLFS